MPLSCWIWGLGRLAPKLRSVQILLWAPAAEMWTWQKKRNLVSATLRGGEIEQDLQRSLEIHPGELHNMVRSCSSCRTPGLMEAVGFKTRFIWEAWQDCSLYRAYFCQEKVERIYTWAAVMFTSWQLRKETPQTFASTKSVTPEFISVRLKTKRTFYTVDGFRGLSLRGVKFCQIKSFGIDQLNYLAQASLRLLLCRPNLFLEKPLKVCKWHQQTRGLKTVLWKVLSFHWIFSKFYDQGNWGAWLRSLLCWIPEITTCMDTDHSQPWFCPRIVRITGLFLPWCQELLGPAVKADPSCERQSHVAVWACLALPLPSFEPQEIQDLCRGSSQLLKPLHRETQWIGCAGPGAWETWMIFPAIGSVNKEVMFEYLSKTFFF